MRRGYDVNTLWCKINNPAVENCELILKVI
jgi:hypothetical protein